MDRGGPVDFVAGSAAGTGIDVIRNSYMIRCNLIGDLQTCYC